VTPDGPPILDGDVRDVKKWVWSITAVRILLVCVGKEAEGVGAEKRVGVLWRAMLEAWTIV
jgi:hypothetical protein